MQAKLTINRPGDRFEQEADRVADAVMRMPAPGLQRVCGECEQELRHSPAREEVNVPEDERNLQAKGAPGRTPEVTPAVQAQIESLRGRGRPLSLPERSFFEPRLGHDFADVRIHTDARAAEAAQRVHALAYTLGHDIVFGAGRYAPESDGGRRLLAHELAHVVQQDGGGQARPASAEMVSRRSGPAVQRLGDPTQVPADLSCPIATSTPGLVVTNVLFTIESAGLTPIAIADIATFVGNWNAAGADRSVRVDGYASVDGAQPLNWRLSCNRAQAVVAELTAPSSGVPGIPASFIELFAQGETDEFSSALPPNRRATISADLSVPPPPVCANPGVSRSLDLQPVFLRTDPADAAPTGASWTRRFNEANAIWGKVGVTFNELGVVTVDTALKTNGTTDAEINAVRALRVGGGVEVFLVDNEMVSSGGASKAPGPGASCGAAGNIVMSDRGTSDTLLAHELGHILGLQHPGTPPNPGEAGTIMDPSNSNSTANPTRNTLANSNRILCPPATGSTCLNPDP